MPDSRLQEFLQKIAQIESSGGKDLNHKEIQHGIHEGDQAIGRYGMMPNTVRELINRRRTEQTMTPDLQDLDAMDSQKMKQTIESNPELEQQLAEQLGKRVIRRQVADEDKAAYSWNMGHNLAPEEITQEKLQQSPYVDKFQKLKGLMK